MAAWDDDAELFAAARRELFVALVGDVLDQMGLTHQFLPPSVKPIAPGMVVLGRAMPVLEADWFGPGEVAGPLPGPFGLMFRALDELRPREVYLAAGGSPRYAMWGGLMSIRAMALGAAGVVLHGYHRDTAEILRLDFPVASFGGYAQDQAPRGKVVDYRVPIEVEGVRVAPGDVVFGDRDGVVVVPASAVEPAFAAAFEKARGEGEVAKALRGGMSAGTAFETFGLL